MSHNKQNNVGDLSQKLTTEVYNERGIEDLKQMLASKEVDDAKIEPAIILISCQLFSYRVVISSNDIPISFAKLEDIYDNLALQLSDLIADKEVDLEVIKEDVNELLETYKSSNQQRKRIKIEEAIAKLLTDLGLEENGEKELKDYLEQLILQNITIIQDFFINQTSQL